MKRLVAPSLLVLVAISTGVMFARDCPSCIEQSRVNKACAWTGDRSFAVDWNNPSHRRHLVADAQLAEDLAIRHADAEFNRLYGYEAHGGLIDSGRVVRECMARLVGQIETNHAVTPDQIATARGEHSWVFESIAAVSFLPLYVFAALVVARRLTRRFSAEPRSVRLAAVGLMSLVATFLGFQVGLLWLGVWAALRVRNGHMSPFRTAPHTAWPHFHVPALYAGGVLVFWCAAVCCRNTALRRVTRGAAMFTSSMLAAMFADVFLHDVVGYVALAGALAVFYSFVSNVDRVVGVADPRGILLQ